MDRSRISFRFDERSLITIEQLREQSRERFDEVEVRDPETGDVRVLLIPMKEAEHGTD